MKRDSVLVLGAGNSRLQHIIVDEKLGPLFDDNFEKVVTLDKDEASKPDIQWNLEGFPWPLPSEYFDEVHAYEVLEHLGGMGDYEAFFAIWKEIWRVLKPGGLVCATTPWWQSVWAWQDPGHRRVYSPELLLYLSQEQYERQVGVTSMTDYRAFFPKPYSFKIRKAFRNGDDPLGAGFLFILEKETPDADRS